MKINEYVPQNSITTPSSLLERVQQLDQQEIGYYKQPSRNNNLMKIKRNGQGALQQTFKKVKNKKDQFGLRKLVKQQKINNLVKKFAFKLKLNNINSQPVYFQPFQNDDQQSIYNINGIQVSDTAQKVLSMLIALQILVCVFIDSTAVIFPEILQITTVRIIQYLSIIIFLIELVATCTIIKIVQGKKIQKVQNLILNYVQDGLIIDVTYMIVLVGGMFADFHYFRIIILLKLPECFQRIEKLQNSLINTFYKEQYWGLAKVFILNFALAHFLSLTLMLMSNLDRSSNWLTKFHINQCQWFQKYIWGYYWGTTIMLTVGFGDISIANYQEAVCLVLIQTFSCLALAYNINCVGNLITNIKSQDIQKNRNIKAFKLLSNRNNISEDLQIKIHNYIQQSTNIKKKFNFAEEHNFISSLPSQIKADFLKESNKKIFQNLHFLKNLTEKTLLAFSQVIQMKICHPQQVIKKRGQLSGLMILKQGKIGYCTKLTGSQFNNVTIENICIKEGQNPFIISLDFISLEGSIYEVKSQEYSIIYFLNRQKTLENLKTGELDYEHYCFLRDKAKNLSTQFQVIQCQFCKANHTKFDCPKLHFVPLKKHVIDKYLHKVKKQKNRRFTFYQRQKKKLTPLKELARNLRALDIDDKNINQKFVSWRKSKNSQCKASSQMIQSFQSSANIFISKEKLKSYGVVKSIAQSVASLDNIIQIRQDRKKEIQFMAAIMKDEFLSLIKKDQQVWVLQCDQIKNFKYYFIEFNANKLQKVDKWQNHSLCDLFIYL